MKVITIFLVCLELSLGLARCKMPARVAVGTAPSLGGGPQAWIDAPLDGMHLPFSPQTPYEIVFHITDDTGVMAGELSINGKMVEVLANPTPSSRLATLRWNWVPPQPGEYLIETRAQNTAGIWSPIAFVHVFVGEITLTPSPTGTSALLTPTATTTGTPTSTQPVPLSFSSSTSTNFIFFGDCSPNSVDIQVQLTGGEQVHAVVLFVRLKDQTSGSTTAWNAYKSMKSQGNGSYTITLLANSISEVQGSEKSWIQYQFVATGADASVIGRSQVYSDINLERCAGFIPFIRPSWTPVISTPSLTPIIVK